MKCFLCIDFFFPLHLWMHCREGGRDNCNLLYRCAAGKQGVCVYACVFFSSSFLIQWEYVHQTLPHIQLGNAIELNRNPGRSGQRPHKHFTLIECWWFWWSVVTSDILKPTFGVDFCNLEEKVWRGSRILLSTGSPCGFRPISGAISRVF